MLDLTSYDHRRGIMLLNSKDVRTVDSSIFDWKTYNHCALDMLETMRKRMLADTNMDDSIHNACVSDIDAVIKWIKEAESKIDKAREVFR